MTTEGWPEPAPERAFIIPTDRDRRLAFFRNLMQAVGADAFRMMADIDARGWNSGGIDETASNYSRWLCSWIEDTVEEARLVWRASRELGSVE